MGFPRQEYWSGMPFPSPEILPESESEVAQSCLTLSDPHGLQPTRLLHPRDFPGTPVVECHCLLHFESRDRIIFFTQEVKQISRETMTVEEHWKLSRCRKLKDKKRYLSTKDHRSKKFKTKRKYFSWNCKQTTVYKTGSNDRRQYSKAEIKWKGLGRSVQFSSVHFSCLVVSDSLRPHESQHTRPPCPSPTPGVYSNSYVHWVGDAIQSSHTLSSPSPPAPNPSQHQSLFQWVNSLHEVAKVLEFQL